ncbi:MAG: hypothetical protein ACLFRY_12765 [Spirochaetia bacterium]
MMSYTHRRFKSKGWALTSIRIMTCIMTLLIVLFGCDSTGIVGSDNPGEALVLPEGNISDWNLGTRDDVVVVLMDSDAEVVKGYGPVTVEDGAFPGMTIEPPPPEVLLSWEDFQEVYCYELYTMPVTITDDSVRFQSFCYLEVQYTDYGILRGMTVNPRVEISWIYADGSTSITITDFESGDYKVTVDLQLTAGWNRAVFQEDEINKVVTLKTEAEPAGTVWFLE